MRYRRAGQRHSNPDRSFARRIGYETVKEGGGTLLQQAGAALGALVGLLAGRWGMPPTASVITGAIVGGTIGSLGKGLVAATVDQLRERREQRRSTGTGGGRGARGSWRHRGTIVREPAMAHSGESSGLAGQVVSRLDDVVEQLTQAAVKLGEIHREMWASHNTLFGLLAGGRPDVVGHARSQLERSRLHVQDSAVGLTAAADKLRTYRSSI